jgi:hypothetical protein
MYIRKNKISLLHFLLESRKSAWGKGSGRQEVWQEVGRTTCWAYAKPLQTKASEVIETTCHADQQNSRSVAR